MQRAIAGLRPQSRRNTEQTKRRSKDCKAKNSTWLGHSVPPEIVPYPLNRKNQANSLTRAATLLAVGREKQQLPAPALRSR